MSLGLFCASLGVAVAARVALAAWWDGTDSARHSRRRVLRWWNRRS
jgi:hypothetical protein